MCHHNGSFNRFNLRNTAVWRRLDNLLFALVLFRFFDVVVHVRALGTDWVARDKICADTERCALTNCCHLHEVRVVLEESRPALSQTKEVVRRAFDAEEHVVEIVLAAYGLVDGDGALVHNRVLSVQLPASGHELVNLNLAVVQSDSGVSDARSLQHFTISRLCVN